MIEISEVTKRYGHTVAVDHLSFEARPGEVTGFLGPNGAGKSTTMRMVVGLDAPPPAGSLSTATPTGTFASHSATWAPSSRPGPSTVVCAIGTGKTMFLEALGHAAVGSGTRVAWFCLVSLGVLVRRHRADDTVTRAIARILRAELTSLLTLACCRCVDRCR